MANQESSVERAYNQLRNMAINFEFKPEERLNESHLTTALGTSRTPLREALNRLVSERFLTFKNGHGFYCRPLNPQRIAELYEARCAIELECLHLSIDRASDEDIQKLLASLDADGGIYKDEQDVGKLAQMDEDFHIELAQLSCNNELVKMLMNINERLRYVRTINLQLLSNDNSDEFSTSTRLSAHRVIVEALAERDRENALLALRNHIERRSGETTKIVQVAYSQLYVPSFD